MEKRHRPPPKITKQQPFRVSDNEKLDNLNLKKYSLVFIDSELSFCHTFNVQIA